MQAIRTGLHDMGIVLMCKNTMMREAIVKMFATHQGKYRFHFQQEWFGWSPRQVAGANALLPVIIPAKNIGLGPEKTSFFHVLSIPNKISKGTIKVIYDLTILMPGDKVDASEASLLNILNITSFSYGLIVNQVYDSGCIFSPAILDIRPEDYRDKFKAVVFLEIGYQLLHLLFTSLPTVLKICWLLSPPPKLS